MKEPTSTDIQKVYEKFPFPSGGTPLLVQHWTDTLAGFFKKNKLQLRGKKFLDAGCGTGDNLVYFAETFPEMDFFGIDFSASSIEKAQEKIEKRKMGNVRVEKQNLLNLNLRDSFDFVASLGVLHHTTDPKKILKNLVRLMAPNAHIFIDLYGFYGYLQAERFREIIQILEPDHDQIENRLKIMNLFLENWLEIKYPRDPMDPNYISLVDGFVVPLAKSYQIKDCLVLLENSGLRKIQWLDSPKIKEREIIYKTYLNEKKSLRLPATLLQQLQEFPQKELYRFMELLWAPHDYLLTAQK